MDWRARAVTCAAASGAFQSIDDRIALSPAPPIRMSQSRGLQDLIWAMSSGSSVRSFTSASTGGELNRPNPLVTWPSTYAIIWP